MLLKLDLETIKNNLDSGRVGFAVESHLSRLVADMRSRPADPKPRTLTLTIKLLPVAANEGNTVILDTVNAQFFVKSSVPEMFSKVVALEPRKDRHGEQLLFNDLSLDNPRQHTLDELERDEKPEEA